MSTRFGDRIRELRISKGLGLREASRLANIDAGLWSKYESGERRPPSPATKPEEAERLVRQISEILVIETDPYPELLALATLPDDVPTTTVNSLSGHFKRRIRKRKK